MDTYGEIDGALADDVPRVVASAKFGIGAPVRHRVGTPPHEERCPLHGARRAAVGAHATDDSAAKLMPRHQMLGAPA